MSCAGSVRSQLPLRDAASQLKSIPLSAVFSLRRCISSANSPYQNPIPKMPLERGADIRGTFRHATWGVASTPQHLHFHRLLAMAQNIEAFSVMEQCFNVVNGQSAIPPHHAFASQPSPHVETLLRSMGLIYDHAPLLLTGRFHHHHHQDSYLLLHHDGRREGTPVALKLSRCSSAQQQLSETNFISRFTIGWCAYGDDGARQTVKVGYGH
jgi:hypothetical protein